MFIFSVHCCEFQAGKKKGKMYIFPQNKIFTLFCILLRKSNKNNNIPIKKKVSKVKSLSPV